MVRKLPSGSSGNKEIGKLDTTEADKAIPKSIVIYRGEVGGNVRNLMHEWRRVFLPWSSKKLHATRNRMKDFMAISATFSVSHLQLFSAPTAGTSLRIMRFTNGPTLSFRVESFLLRDDIIKMQKRAAPVVGPMYDVAPIVVLNNFNAPNRAPEVALLEQTFQSLFPSINIQTVKTSEIQRVVMFHYDPSTGMIEVRHYYIDTKATNLSKTVKKLTERRIPTKLGALDNVDDVFDKEGAWSDTDGEGEEVQLPERFRTHKDQCRIKLVEIGPRLTLRLIKVEAGFAKGEVLYHNLFTKSSEEVAVAATKVRKDASEKAARRRIQDDNVKKKDDAKNERVKRKKAKRARLETNQKKADFEGGDDFGGDADGEDE